MEKIEFRVWNNYDKEMYYNVAVGGNLVILDYKVKKTFDADDELDYYIDFNSYVYLTKENEKYFNIMQYTGFKDKSGKKIFEGDIIEFIHNNGNVTKDYIMFENGRFTTGLGYNIHYFVMRRDGVKVIGNIYQDKGFKAYIDYPDGL